MRLHEDINFTTLAWVKPELDETLRLARRALEDHVENPGDSSPMRYCATYLHQVQGSLRMVELYGAAMVAEQMERLANALAGEDADGEIADREEAFTALMRGIVQLPDYLERIQAGFKDIPLVLLPLLNELLTAHGRAEVSESALFMPDLIRALPEKASGPGAALSVQQARERAEALRAGYQTALLSWLREDSGSDALKTLAEICDELVGLVSNEAARRLFWVTAGEFAALADSVIEPSSALRQALGRVEREIKRLAEDGENAFTTEPPLELTRELLYFVAHAPAGHARLDQLRQVFDLDSYLPSEQELLHAQSSMSGHNQALLATVSSAIKDDLLRVKDALDLYMRNMNVPIQAQAAQLAVLAGVAETLGMLGLAMPRRIVQEQHHALQELIDGTRPVDESTLLDIAGALLYVEASLDDQVRHLGPSAVDAVDSADQAWSVPESEARQVLDVVMREAAANFAQARQCFVAFVETSWDHAQLADVPHLLGEVAGALRILQVEDAPRYLDAVARFTSEQLVARRIVPNAHQLDSLADALASLEYYFEALAERRGGRDRILETTRASLARLGVEALAQRQAPAPAATGKEASRPVAPDLIASNVEPEADLTVRAPVASASFEPPLAFEPEQAEPSADASRPESAPEPVLPDVSEPDQIVVTQPAEAIAATAQDSVAGIPVTPVPEHDEIVAAKADSAAEPAPATGATSGFEATSDAIDDEIREVFLEEVEEETENLDRLLELWRQAPDDMERLRPIRRVFHTLKGSGRLVGAMVLGEFSWHIENALNRVLDGHRPMSASVPRLVDAARGMLPTLQSMLGGRQHDPAPLLQLQEAARRFADGEPLVLPEAVGSAFVGSEPTVAAEPEELAAVGFEDGSGTELLSRTGPEAVPDGMTSDADGTPVAIDPVLLEILLAEVGGHLQTMQGWLGACEQSPQWVTEPLLRAVHTINGALAMAEVPLIPDVTTPLEGFARRQLASGLTASDEARALFGEAVTALQDTVHALAQPQPRLRGYGDLPQRLQALRDSLPEIKRTLSAADEDVGTHEAFWPEVSLPEAPDFGALEPGESIDRIETADAPEPHEPAPDEPALDELAPVAPSPADEAAFAEDAPFFDDVSFSDYGSLSDQDPGAEDASLLAAGDHAVSATALEGIPPERIDQHADSQAESGSAAAAGADVGEPAKQPGAAPTDAPGIVDQAAMDRFDRLIQSFSEQMEAEDVAGLSPVTGEQADAGSADQEAELHIGEDDSELSSEADVSQAAESPPVASESTGPGAFVEPASADSSIYTPEELAELESMFAAEAEVGDELGSDADVQPDDEAGTRAGEAIADTDGSASIEPAAPAEAGSELELVTQAEAVTDQAQLDRLDSSQADDESGEIEPEPSEALTAETDLPAQPEVEAAPSAPEPSSAGLAGVRPGLAEDPDPDQPLDLTDLDTELLDIFIEESSDLLDSSDALVARLRESPGALEPISGLQRDLHTLKGGARMAGIMAVGELGHVMESLLESVAEGRRELDRDGIRLLESGLDRLHAMLGRIAERRAVALPTTLIDRFTAVARGQAYVSRADAPIALTPLTAPLADDELAFDEETASVRAPQEQVRIRADLLDRLVNYAGEVAIYRSRLEQQLGDFRVNLHELDQTNIRLRDQLRKLDIETEAQIIARYQRETDTGDPDFDPLEMDRFSTLQQLSRALAESAADLTALQSTLEDLTRQYEALLLQQSRVSTDLQEGLMRTRMVPFEALVPRLRRVLRQAGGELGKQVQLRVEGTQGEMDRSVLERMTPPLEHMLRNAIAHGLETPAERKKAGKPEEGTVEVAVSREGSEVVITVADDGRGLDAEAIRRKAIERGRLDADASIDEGQLYAFILETGFSTAASVSRLAGRGVGMDVVHNEIRQLGGSLQIDSVAGKGTRFVIRLPFSLAVTQAVFIRIGEASHAVPIASVKGVGRIDREQLNRELAEGSAIYSYAGEEYPIYDLGRLLHQGPAKASESLQVPLLLIQSGELHAAVLVDQVLGNREIVVKPVGPQVSSIPGVFGATIMGDGSVVVILDIAPLVRRQAAHAVSGRPSIGPVAVQSRTAPLVMVVDDSITMRKVTGRVLERHNVEVVAAKDGIDAIEKMAERVPDLMLLDVEMPRMDGYELAIHMRADSRLSKVPIIMITSRTGEKHRQRALDVGVNGYLGKPYQETELMKRVFELLPTGRVDE